jgi:hypothetical protein
MLNRLRETLSLFVGTLEGVKVQELLVGRKF